MSELRLHPSFWFVFQWSAFYVVCLAAWVSNANAEVRVVVPPSMEAMEGNSWNARIPTPVDGFRVQNLIEASNFADVPEDHRVITALSWRPDRDVTGENLFFDESLVPLLQACLIW